MIWSRYNSRGHWPILIGPFLTANVGCMAIKGTDPDPDASGSGSVVGSFLSGYNLRQVEGVKGALAGLKSRQPSPRLKSVTLFVKILDSNVSFITLIILTIKM